MTAVVAERLTRQEIIVALRARDGDVCAYPDCDEVLNFDMDYTSLLQEDPRRRFEVTIDHHYPQHAAKTDGWSYEQIWDISNLRLMTKKCNAKKGDRIPNDDGTLPEKPVRKFRYRRDKRASRPDLCLQCNNGHDLMVGEYCASCGCDAQRFPRSAKVRYDECDHELLWCWVCSITPNMRPSSIGTAMRQADSDELGEFLIED